VVPSLISQPCSNQAGQPQGIGGNSRPALAMTRGVRIMAERTIPPLPPSVKPPSSKVDPQHYCNITATLLCCDEWAVGLRSANSVLALRMLKGT